MKTRDRILATSLLLFNDEGEPNVTTVDIANEMDISPGNLYYHFKGKEAIIEAIYHNFDEELTDILRAPLDNNVSVEDSWFYLYVVFEQIYSFRFFYQNLSDILQRYDSINKRFKRLLDLKVRTAAAVVNELIEHEVLDIAPDEIDQLCNNITMTLTYWITYRQLRSPGQQEMQLFHDGVFQIIHLIAPYLTEDYHYIYRQCRELYEAAVAQLNS
ncbi:MAG: TetR/AcrR family transcriptional regulator [Pseudomonadales bacterium]